MIFRPNTIFLVYEGDTEDTVIRSIFQTHGINEKREGVVLFSADGKGNIKKDLNLLTRQLKKNGICSFWTTEEGLRNAYPGTFGYRIRNVTITPEYSTLSVPIKGVLKNEGFSRVSRSDGEMRVLSRFTEVIPLSEFNLRSDMKVLGLPDDHLLTLEGSGIETFWNLEFPSITDPYGLDNLTDIVLTFDLLAQYSVNLEEKSRKTKRNKIQHLILISARKYQSKFLKEFKEKEHFVVVEIDVDQIGLPRSELNHKVKNLIIFLSGSKIPTKVKGIFKSTRPLIERNLTFENGIANSNLFPLSTEPHTSMPEKLNDFVDIPVKQKFVITFNKKDNPGEDLSGIGDVVLGIEYSADIK